MKKDKCLKKLKLHKMLRPEVLRELNDNLRDFHHARSLNFGDGHPLFWRTHSHGHHGHWPQYPWGSHEHAQRSRWDLRGREPFGPWSPHRPGPFGLMGPHGHNLHRFERPDPWGFFERHSGGKDANRRCKAGHINQDDDHFSVKVDVKDFLSNDLSVKVIENSVVIEGQHDERDDEDGLMERHFKKRFVVPEGYDKEKVYSTLSSDGVLTVRVPKIEKEVKERIVEIIEVPESDDEDDIEEEITERMNEMQT